MTNGNFSISAKGGRGMRSWLRARGILVMKRHRVDPAPDAMTYALVNGLEGDTSGLRTGEMPVSVGSHERPKLYQK